MTSRKASLRLTLPMGIAAFVLTIAGPLAPASAAGSWMYIDDVGQPCLTSSTASDNIWVQYDCQAIGATLWR